MTRLVAQLEQRVQRQMRGYYFLLAALYLALVIPLTFVAKRLERQVAPVSAR